MKQDSLRGVAAGAFGGLAAVLMVTCADVQTNPFDTDGAVDSEDGTTDAPQRDSDPRDSDRGETDRTDTDGGTPGAGPSGLYSGAFHWEDRTGAVIFEQEDTVIFDSDGMMWRYSAFGPQFNQVYYRYYLAEGCSGASVVFALSPRTPFKLQGESGYWVVDDTATYAPATAVLSYTGPSGCAPYPTTLPAGQYISGANVQRAPSATPPSTSAVQWPVHPVAH